MAPMAMGETSRPVRPSLRYCTETPKLMPYRRVVRYHSQPYRRVLRFGKAAGGAVSQPTTGPVRAHALRNREHILQVASEAFAESGTTSLNAIAKRAGVGAGTLYRHFPTREDLILAVYQRDVQRLVDSVPDILAEHPPLDSFRIWFLTLADSIRVKHGLGDALYTASTQDVVNEAYAPVIAAVTVLLRACAEGAALGAGLAPDAVPLLRGFLGPPPATEAGREQARRLLDLVIDGLRPR